MLFLSSMFEHILAVAVYTVYKLKPHHTLKIIQLCYNRSTTTRTFVCRSVHSLHILVIRQSWRNAEVCARFTYMISQQKLQPTEKETDGSDNTLVYIFQCILPSEK